LKPALAVLLLLGLAACTSPAPQASVPVSSAPVTVGPLYDATVILNLVDPRTQRSVQVLPGLWDGATVSVNAQRARNVATSSWTTGASSASTLAPTISVPTGPATISVYLYTGSTFMASGSTTQTLVSGTNTATVSLTTYFTFPGTIAN